METIVRHPSVGSAQHRGRGSDERGVILVWTAIMLVLLLGVAAFAIDVAGWHLEQTREQRAADAASLAGAVTFPNDPTTSNTAALGIAQNNGYPATTLSPFGVNGSCPLAANQTVRVCAGPGAESYQYKVKVVRRVANLFGGVFGIGHSTVSASATAEYLKPLSMGSPSNQFGDDPDSISKFPNASPPPQTYPNFWANIAGGSSVKQNGDAYTAGTCDNLTDGCSGGGANVNLDKKSGGYYYVVDFTGTGTVNLQAFDPAFVNVGDTCNSGSLTGASGLGSVPGYPAGPYPFGRNESQDIAIRYLAVTTSNQNDQGLWYCSGDNLFGSGPPPTTTFTVLEATIPGDPSSAVPVGGCSPQVYPGINDASLATSLKAGQRDSQGRYVASYFRQWATLCQVTGNPGDEYFIEVSTDAASQGHNRFSLRGVQSNGSPAPVTIAGNTYMAIYANAGAALSQFYLARVPTAAANHTLVLNFYDIGDASSVGQLQIVPPSDANLGSTFTGNTCKWTGNSSTGALGFAANTPASPWGPFTPITNCLIGNVNGGGTWNAQWSTVEIPIPANYKCNDTDPNGCWVKINYQFAGGVNDTTSWNAYLLGDPVRLVQ